MTLSSTIRRALLSRVRNVMARREPDFIIGDNYLRRWWLIPKNRWLNVYLHEFRASDDDRALHDHPWASCSIILRGEYFEHLPADPNNPAGPTVPHIRIAGDINVRRANQPHRIELPRYPHQPVITLFLTGPRVREWGFWCPKGWKHWRRFTAPSDSGQIGAGCGED